MLDRISGYFYSLKQVIKASDFRTEGSSLSLVYVHSLSNNCVTYGYSFIAEWIPNVSLKKMKQICWAGFFFFLFSFINRLLKLPSILNYFGAYH